MRTKLSINNLDKREVNLHI